MSAVIIEQKLTSPPVGIYNSQKKCDPMNNDYYIFNVFAAINLYQSVLESKLCHRHRFLQI